MRQRVKTHCVAYGILEPRKTRAGSAMKRTWSGAARRRHVPQPRAGIVLSTTDGEMDMGDEAEATGSDPGEQRIGNKVLLNFHLYAEYHSRPRAWVYQNYMYLKDRMCIQQTIIWFIS